MKNPLKIALLSSALLCPCLENTIHAQGLSATAQMTTQQLGNGTYDYTISLLNNGTTSINQFWFAWVPDVYGYDLLGSAPSIIQTPTLWYGYPDHNSSYYPDGNSLDFINFYGSAYDLAPGQTDMFVINTPDSPDTLNQTSGFFSVPTLTSYVFDDNGNELAITMIASAVPEPSTLSLLSGGGVMGLLFLARNRKTLLRQPLK